MASVLEASEVDAARKGSYRLAKAVRKRLEAADLLCDPTLRARDIWPLLPSSAALFVPAPVGELGGDRPSPYDGLNEEEALEAMGWRRCGCPDGCGECASMDGWVLADDCDRRRMEWLAAHAPDWLAANAAGLDPRDKLALGQLEARA